VTTKYLWWRSPYDSQVHAFPATQATDRTLHQYHAACMHTAPADELVRRREGRVCTGCLIRVGSQLPEASLLPTA
jgi:hypothetical protein